MTRPLPSLKDPVSSMIVTTSVWMLSMMKTSTAQPVAPVIQPSVNPIGPSLPGMVKILKKP